MTARAGLLAAALGLGLAGAAAAAPALVAAPDPSGPDLAPEGASLLEEVFPDGLPFPFAAVLDRLRAQAGDEHVATALIPLGRSLQRYGAAPDYFASPRVVVAVTGDRAAGPEDPRLADRLFLGYQPAAAVIEAIAWNPAAGRFEFRELVGYAADGARAAEPASREVCLACHQGGGPIFPRPLWSETNADPAVAARLAGLGAAFHGAPARASVDAMEAFDAATDRAGRIALADRLWSEGCPDPACRAALLVAALRVGLGAAPGPAPAAFAASSEARWPDGLAAIPPDLPNRAAGPLLAPGDPAPRLETAGALDPETPRPPVTLWRPGAGGFAAAAAAVAAAFAPGDLAWIDRRLGARAAAAETRSLPCKTRRVALAEGAETRFACAGERGQARGFITPTGSGRIQALWLGAEPALGQVAFRAEAVAGGTRFTPTGLAPRLADGRRLAEATLGGGAVALRLVDDLGPLAARLAASDAAALGPGPIDRRALLGLVAELTEAADG